MLVVLYSVLPINNLNTQTALNSLCILPFGIITLDRKFISTSTKESVPRYGKLNSEYVTGFSDGEACFTVHIYKDTKRTNGYNTTPIFSIGLHNKDIELLKRIKTYFGEVGKIVLVNSVWIYQVRSLKELTTAIVPHFDKYPLLTNKKADYLLFKKILDLMARKEHLTEEGLKKLLQLRCQ